MIESGFITPKKAKKFDFPIPITGKYKSAGKGFLTFCVRALSMAADSAPKIYFELPEIPYQPVSGEMILHVQKDGKTVQKQELAVVNPLANLATMMMDERALGMYANIGKRLAIKHAAALFTSYMAYKAAKKKLGDFLAFNSAILTYAAANKGIEASERADLRNWSLLPHHYRLTSLDLPPGNYNLLLEKKTAQGSVMKNLGSVALTKESKKLAKMVSYRAY